MQAKIPLRVDPNFSVYDTFMKIRPLNIFSEHPKMLHKWCSIIEDKIIQESFNIKVFAGFQQLEYFLPIVERYKKIAEVAQNVYIFGKPYADMPTIDKLHYVHLKPEDQLSKEWFLVIKHESYTRSLASLNMSEDDTPRSHRIFKGVLTSDSAIIDVAYQQLLQQVSTHNQQILSNAST
jgi:DICT domain-containing protein